MKALIVYWSGTGNTRGMAEAIADGVKAEGWEADVFSVSDFGGGFDGYDKIFLGCPAMGGEELEESEFLPFYEKNKAALSGRQVGLFGSYGWGDGEWMRNWEKDLAGTGASLIGGKGFICQESQDGIYAACVDYAKKSIS